MYKTTHERIPRVYTQELKPVTINIPQYNPHVLYYVSIL